MYKSHYWPLQEVGYLRLSFDRFQYSKSSFLGQRRTFYKAISFRLFLNSRNVQQTRKIQHTDLINVPVLLLEIQQMEVTS